MQRYFINLSYDGTNYHGWQSQDNAHSVQAEIENALSVLLKEEILITGAGRTDAGVHARNYFAHFDVEAALNKEFIDDLVYRMNSILPLDISVLNIIPVKNDAHARFSALSRTYRYYICRSKDPFNINYTWRLAGNINISAMNEAANVLFEYIDFTSFSKLHTDVKTNNCKIIHAQWTEENSLLVFTITADRFLRNMVRAIVGTLIEVGQGKVNIEEFKKIIESKNRSDAGQSVPAKALFLENIEYPEEIFILES